MDFDIIDDDGATAILAPLRVSILHTNYVINLQDRLTAIAQDFANVENIKKSHPALGLAVQKHRDEVFKGVNSTTIKDAANEAIRVQSEIFGMTNAGSAEKIEELSKLPPSDLEASLQGKEGRLLTRLHSYKERDRKFSQQTKQYYKSKNGGKLICDGCGVDPNTRYGASGERCVEAHHKVPIEELQPDSITTVEEMAILCANCHRIVHSKKPCLTVDELRALLRQNGQLGGQ
jgi:predicted HNH restriction endonuclease